MNYTKVQRIAWAILLVTDGVRSDELEALGISKKQADAWSNHLLKRKISFEDAMQIFSNGDTEVSINHLLTLCLDQRAYTKINTLKNTNESNNKNKTENTCTKQ